MGNYILSFSENVIQRICDCFSTNIDDAPLFSFGFNKKSFKWIFFETFMRQKHPGIKIINHKECEWILPDGQLIEKCGKWRFDLPKVPPKPLPVGYNLVSTQEMPTWITYPKDLTQEEKDIIIKNEGKVVELGTGEFDQDLRVTDNGVE